MNKKFWMTLALAVLFVLPVFMAGCGSSGGASVMTITCNPNPITGSLINNNTQKRWSFTLTFANSGSKNILVSSGTYVLTTPQGSDTGNVNITAFTITANSSNPQGYLFTTGSSGGQPTFLTGSVVYTFNGSLTGGGTATANVTVTLQ